MTYTLARFRLSDVVSLCGALTESTADASTMEDAASAVVRLLRGAFRDHGTAEPEIVLARCFMTLRADALPPDLREYAAARASTPLGDAVRCLTLLGTDGDRAEWCDRHRSEGHRAIPLPSTEALAAAPMIAGLVEQLGVGVETFLEGAKPDDGSATPDDFDVFFVPDAVASPQVPAQDFVERHGVRSVLGFGGFLPGGDVFTVVLFIRTRVDEPVAQMFRTIAVATKLALLPSLSAPLFHGGANRPVARTEADRVHVRALKQMLTVQQQSVATQAAVLEEAVRQAERLRLRALREVETTETLREIGTQLASELTMDRVAQAATDAATRATGAKFGALLCSVVGSSGEYHRLRSFAGVAPEAFVGIAERGDVESFVPSVARGQPVRREDIRVAQQALPGSPFADVPELGVRSYMAVPIVSRGGAVHGGLFFGHPDAGVFDTRAERLAVGVAGQAAIALDNARLYEAQRSTAVELQRSLLMPQALPVPEGLEVAYEYLPGTSGTDVGGDWFDLIPLAGGRVAFVIGDVMGRGLHAAAIMGQLRTAVRAYAVIDLPPTELVDRFNHLVCDMGEDLIATCVYAVYDPGDDQLTYTNAGHLPPALVGRSGDVRLLEAGLGPPLGVPHAVYHEHELTFPEGARLLLFTDGLVERRDVPIEDGLVSLQEVLRAARGPLRWVCKDLIAQMLDPALQDDDVTLLAIGNVGAELAQASRRLAPDRRAPGQARAFVRDVLGGWSASQTDIDHVASVADELVTNALVHAASESTLRLRRLATGIVVEVADLDPHLPRLEQAEPDHHQRGLRIVAALSSRWGARPTREGKIVWAEFVSE